VQQILSSLVLCHPSRYRSSTTDEPKQLKLGWVVSEIIGIAIVNLVVALPGAKVLLLGLNLIYQVLSSVDTNLEQKIKKKHPRMAFRCYIADVYVSERSIMLSQELYEECKDLYLNGMSVSKICSINI